MTEQLRERLASLGDRGGDAPTFEQLRKVRSRRDRARRVSALVVAVMVAVAGTSVAWVATRGGGTGSQPIATPPAEPEIPTIWPEAWGRDDLAAVTAAQAQADDLVANVLWRIEPDLVVQRFTTRVLGWTDASIRLVEESPGRVIYATDPCGPSTGCDAAEGLTVWLVQPARVGGDGIWSVQAVVSDRLDVGVEPMDPVAGLGAGTLEMFLDLPAAVSAHVGIRAWNGCTEASAFDIGLPAGPATLDVPEPGAPTDTCGDLGAGYLFAYATDDTTVPVGDPLLEAAAIEFPWLTVVPVYVVMERGPSATATASPTAHTASATPEVLTVSCYGDQRTTVGPRVIAQPDGVHLLIEGTDAYVEVRIDGAFRRIEDAPRELVLPLPPGQHAVDCILPGASQVADPQSFEVIDPEGHWLDPTIDCATPDSADFDTGPIAVDGDPADELLSAGEGILRFRFDAPPGSFVFGGYPGSRQERTVVLVDVEGSVIGIVTFSNYGEQWFPGSYSYCSGGADI